MSQNKIVKHFSKSLTNFNQLVVVDHFTKSQLLPFGWGFSLMYFTIFFMLSFQLINPWIAIISILQLLITIIGGCLLIKMSANGLVVKWKYDLSIAIFIFPLIFFFLEFLTISFIFFYYL